MAVLVQQKGEGHPAGKRIKRFAVPHVRRAAPAQNPAVLILAVAGALVLVLGVIGGALAFSKPGSTDSSGSEKKAAAPAVVAEQKPTVATPVVEQKPAPPPPVEQK